MTTGYHIVVCGTLVPDPLQTLEPVQSPAGPALKNEAMLPSVLDPWAGHALYEAAHLAKSNQGSKVWLVSLGPKAKLQQLMMTIAQKAPFELVVVDGSASGFTDSYEIAKALAGAIEKIQGLDRSRLLLFGGCASASRDASVIMQMIGERLGIHDQFLGVDELKAETDGSLKIAERVEGGKYQMSVCAGPPAVLAWATGNLPEPPNNPQIGMANMRNMMPAIQKAQPAGLAASTIQYAGVEVPKQQRQTRIVKDIPAEEIAKDILNWLKG
ncbi:MAG: electron transfer flavoprotein subunit beta [Candidatus Omnitrophica bacterium]|nr:electron transfer flavoprotein subunit beta [Candidatus Omnitrophota bacterium]